MVYCGKPSAACLPCRQKRRKCDGLRPVCTQCTRASVPCRGYRDLSTEVFRDQTSAIARKAQRAKASRSRRSHSPLSNPRTPPLSNPCSPPYPGVSDLHISRSLPPLPEDVASAYFITVYAPSSPFFSVPTLLTASHTSTTPPVPFSAVLAPALALLAQETREPRLLPLARRHYVAAVAATNALVAAHATADATLASVLLLGLFEASVFRGGSSPVWWTAHTGGAEALLRLRGAAHFRTPLGAALFVQACANVRTSYLQRDLAVPVDLVRLQAQLAAAAGSAEWGLSMLLRLGDVLDAVAALLGRVRRSSRGGVQGDLAGFVAGGLETDARVEALMVELEEQDPIGVAVGGQGAAGYRYKDFRVARRWNVLRMIRVFLNGWMHQAALHHMMDPDGGSDGLLLGRHDLLLDSTRTTAGAAARDILSSVPYFLDSTKTSLVVVKSLVWPLCCVAACPAIQDAIVSQARGSLEALATGLGLEQAMEALRTLDEKHDMGDWMHIWCVS